MKAPVQNENRKVEEPKVEEVKINVQLEPLLLENIKLDDNQFYPSLGATTAVIEEEQPKLSNISSMKSELSSEVSQEEEKTTSLQNETFGDTSAGVP